jgi:hypothetical protein
MLSCIIVHYPYPHPPRSAHTGDTLIPGSQSESTKNYKDHILEQKHFLLEGKLRTGGGSQ